MLSPSFGSPWSESIMLALMLQTSLKYFAGGVLAVLTGWHLASRMCTCLQFPSSAPDGAVGGGLSAGQHQCGIMWMRRLREVIRVDECPRRKRVSVGTGSFDSWFQVSSKASVTGPPPSSPTASSRLVKLAKGTFNHHLWRHLSSHLFVIST